MKLSWKKNREPEQLEKKLAAAENNSTFQT